MSYRYLLNRKTNTIFTGIVLTIGLAFMFLLPPLYGQNVIAPSDPSVTTDTLRSGDLVLGINSNGGGVINYLCLPAAGNIFGPQSVLYGRSGQSSIRDGMHRGRYNPTQAGFNETLGTPCLVQKSPDKLLIPPRPLALWYGDCEWDFTEWENIGPDPACYSDGGNTDTDGLDESNLEGKQNTEVKSEFDYFGKYHNYSGKGGIDIACVRHYFEYRFVRQPGHCLSQFRPGLPIFDPGQANPDISVSFPAGKHPADPFDLSNTDLSWHTRNDVVKWDPEYQFLKNSDGTWIIQPREALVKESVDLNGKVIVPRLIVVSDSNNPDAPGALGFYMPVSEFNNHETIGVNENTGLIEYKDKRCTSVRIWDQPRRIAAMALSGFKIATAGLLNRSRLPANMYEAIRCDLFILMGSPDEIWKSVQKLENAPLSWNFSEGQENWRVPGDLPAISGDGLLKMNLIGPNSVIMSPDSLLIDADLQKFVTLRIRNKTVATSATITFRGYENPEEFRQEVAIPAENDSLVTIPVNLTGNKGWQGIIRQFGISFPGAQGPVDVDFIAVSADNLSDCHGDFQGTAWNDGCHRCVGGNTGLTSCEDCMGITNGEAVLNKCGNCVGGTSPVTTFSEWNFDKLSDWTLNARLSATSGGGSSLLSISGNDPYMNFNGNVCIDTKLHKYLKVILKNNTNGTTPALYFKNDVTNSWKYKSFTITQYDIQMKTYILDLSGNENWTGNVYAIRFDPPGTDGTVELNYIGLLTQETLSTGLDRGASISPGKTNGLRVFPNPVSDRINFTIFTPGYGLLEILSLSGQKLFTCPIRNAGIHSVPFRDFSAGIYILRIIQGEHLTSVRILKK